MMNVVRAKIANGVQRTVTTGKRIATVAAVCVLVFMGCGKPAKESPGIREPAEETRRAAVPGRALSWDDWGISFEPPAGWQRWTKENESTGQQLLANQLASTSRSHLHSAAWTTPNEEAFLLLGLFYDRDDPTLPELLSEEEKKVEKLRHAGDVATVNAIEVSRIGTLEFVKTDLTRANGGRGVCYYFAEGHQIVCFVFVVADSRSFAEYEGILQCVMSSVSFTAAHRGPSSVDALAFSPDGNLLCSGSYGTLKFWRMPGGEHFKTLFPNGEIKQITFSSDGASLQAALGTCDVGFEHWRIADATLQRSVQTDNNQERGHASVFSPDMRTFASSDYGTTIYIRDRNTGTVSHKLTSHTSMVTALAFSTDGAMLASGSYDKTIKLWDVASGRLKATLDAGDNVTQLCFCREGGLVAAALMNTTVQLWDVGSRKLRKTLPAQGHNAPTIACNLDGSILAVGSGANTHPAPPSISLWAMPSGKRLKTLITLRQRADLLLFSPDGHFLVSAAGVSDATTNPTTGFGTITVLEMPSGRFVRCLGASASDHLGE